MVGLLTLRPKYGKPPWHSHSASTDCQQKHNKSCWLGKPWEGKLWSPHQHVPCWRLPQCLLKNEVLFCIYPWPIWLQLYHYSLLSPSFHYLHEFLWSLLREEGRHLKVERRVGVKLIWTGDSNCQSTDFSKMPFLFPSDKLPFLECSGDDVSWNSHTSLLFRCY